MAQISRSFIMAIVAIGLVACQPGANAPSASGPADGAIAVMRVDAADLLVMESYPEKYVITAEGIVRSGGWSAPRLSARRNGALTEDGIYEVDFLAIPPDGPATAVLSPISARQALTSYPANLRGIRVFAETNSQTIIFE